MRVLSLLIIFTFCVTLSTHAQGYLWPTDSGNYLSSTFGETRSAHFHAGLDIKTWGREGYRVFAAKDGVLYRLLITERGYGNAIYIKHPDDTFTVYAHLQRFNSELQEIADSIRIQDFSFEMDEYLETNGIEIKQGEVIGYTGSTGIGPPHLHFEIRDSLQNPLNALHAGFEIKDTVPPVFSSLIIEPLTQKSRVDGKPLPLTLKPKSKTEQYKFGTVKTTGSVGLAINVYDQANDVYNAYAVHELTLMQGPDTLFHQALNTFEFAHDQEMFIDRIAPFGSSRRGHQRLYGKEGNNNPFYLIDRENAKIKASDVPVTYTIIAKDFFGNTSSAEVTITGGQIPEKTTHKSWLAPDKWYWSESWFSPDQKNTYSFKDLDGFSISAKHKILKLPGTANSLNFYQIDSDSAHKLNSNDRDLRLHFSPNTFFDSQLLAISHIQTDSSNVVSIFPNTAPLKSSYIAEIYMRKNFEPGNKYNLYHVDPNDGDLGYVDSELRGRTMLAFPDKFGTFIIVSDDIQPKISNLRIVKSEYGKWFVTATVKDELSGIKSSEAIFTVNGVRGIAEYDYEEEELRYYHPDFKPEAINTVSIAIKDKAGNETILTDTIPLTGR